MGNIIQHSAFSTQHLHFFGCLKAQQIDAGLQDVPGQTDQGDAVYCLPQFTAILWENK